MARLTLCLIARNEEALLPGCLASVQGVVDEIVLVDTGSTDRTVAIARQAGATVLSRPWDDDFSAPRNLAARQARGGWILMLDADERLAPGAGPVLRRAIRGGGFDLGMVRLHNASRPDASAAEVLSGAARAGTVLLLPRVFHNVDGLEWRGAIHESTGEWLLRRRGRRVALGVDLVHYGYTPDLMAARSKRSRNIALLRKRCALEPEDVTPAGYLALELLEGGEFEEAARVVERAWAQLDGQPSYRCFARIASARSLLALRAADAPMALETAERAERQNGPHPDFDYVRGMACEILAVRATPRTPDRLELLARAQAAFQAARRRLAEDGPFEYLGSATELRCLLHLGVLRLLLGELQAALQSFTEALRLDARNGSARVGAAEALVELGQPAKALELVEQALGAGPDGWLVAAAAAHALGSLGDARLLFGRAQERRGHGYECLHRWARHEAMERSLGPG